MDAWWESKDLGIRAVVTHTKNLLVHDLKAAGQWNDGVRDQIKRDDGSVQNIATLPTDLRAPLEATGYAVQLEGNGDGDGRVDRPLDARALAEPLQQDVDAEREADHRDRRSGRATGDVGKHALEIDRVPGVVAAGVGEGLAPSRGS